MDGRPRFLGKNSSLGSVFDEGSLFSESDWLIATSTISPLVKVADELASSGALASKLILGLLAALSASIAHRNREWCEVYQKE